MTQRIVPCAQHHVVLGSGQKHTPPAAEAVGQTSNVPRQQSLIYV